MATTRGSDAIFQGVISKKAMQHVTFMGFLENKQTNKSDLSVGHVEDQLFDPQQSQRVLFSDCNITKQTAGFVSVPGPLQVCVCASLSALQMPIHRYGHYTLAVPFWCCTANVIVCLKSEVLKTTLGKPDVCHRTNHIFFFPAAALAS